MFTLKFSLLFPNCKAISFLTMLLVRGRCYLYLEWTYECGGSLVMYGDSCNSYINIQITRIFFSCMLCKKPLGLTLKKLEINLTDLLCPFVFTNDANAPVLFQVCVIALMHSRSWPSRINLGYLIIFRVLVSAIIHNYFSWNMVSVIPFFRLFILCQLSCQSSSLYI